METNRNNVIKNELTEEQKKYQAEMEAKQKEFKELLESPIDAADADKKIAEIEVNRCRIRAYVSSLSEQQQAISARIMKAESQLVDLDGEEAIIRRRRLNGGK